MFICIIYDNMYYMCVCGARCKVVVSSCGHSIAIHFYFYFFCLGAGLVHDEKSNDASFCYFCPPSLFFFFFPVWVQVQLAIKKVMTSLFFFFLVYVLLVEFRFGS